MSKALSALWLAAIIAIGANGAETKRAHYIDLTANFSRFVDETGGMEEAVRVACPSIYCTLSAKWTVGFASSAARTT
jgi:hypothetical protein